METYFQQSKAKWIWVTNNVYTANCYALFSRYFNATSVNDVQSIMISCSSFSEYKIYLNENYVGRGGIPANYFYQYCDRFLLEKDNLKVLLCNQNSLLIIAHHEGVGTHHRQFSGAGILFSLEIEWSNGEKEVIVSDKLWDAMISPCWNQATPQMFWTTGFQEDVHFENVISNYKNKYLSQIVGRRSNKSIVAESKDMFWNKAVEINPHLSDEIKILKKPIPHLTETLVYPQEQIDFGECILRYEENWTVNPADIIINEGHTGAKNSRLEFLDDNDFNNGFRIVTDIKSNVFITFDFGTEVIGYPYFQFETSTDGIAVIGYSECLDNKGRVDPTRQGIRQADTIEFHKGQFEWEMFGRRAFRFMQITLRGIEGIIKFKKVAINHVYYPFTYEGKFWCDNERLNCIYNISKRTLSLCMKENYEDCPLRERAQYIGDIKTEALMNYYAFGDLHLVKKGLQQFAQIQMDNGWIKSIAPGSTNHNIVDYLPLWITAIREYYLFSGDRNTSEDIYSNVKRLIAWLNQHTLNNGFLSTKPDWWIFIDWADIDKQDVITALQCLFYKALIDASYLAKVTSHLQDAICYAKQAKQLRENINESLWDTEKGAYVDSIAIDKYVEPKFSIQTNCMAVYSGVASNDKKEAIRVFLDNWTGKKIITGYFKLYELETYFRLGNFERFINGFNYWGKMIEAGATTWWEVFDEDHIEQIPDCSLCHGWSAGPLYLLPSKLLGIYPLKPGYREFIFRPNFFEIKEIYVEVPTPAGIITAMVTALDEEFKVRLTVPGNLTAHMFISLPWESCDSVKISPNPDCQRRLNSGLLYYRVIQNNDFCINFEVSRTRAS